MPSNPEGSLYACYTKKRKSIQQQKAQAMRKQYQENRFHQWEGPLNAPPLHPPAIHDNKKITLLQWQYLPSISRRILLGMSIFVLVACLHYYKQDAESYFLSPSADFRNSRIAICLVGGARRFELTGPTILKHVLNVFPEADLFVHSNLDNNTFKLGLLRSAPRVTEVRIRRPVVLPENDGHKVLLSGSSSPNGIQGLLQYFDLVEGCLHMISGSESRGNFTYDWIFRTRVDGYWTGPLDSKAFKQGTYVVPEGSRFGGLNDRLGIGNHYHSSVALSRLSLLPHLASAGFHDMNSETAFQAQLKVFNITAKEFRLPFCILSDRQLEYPLGLYGIPVASISSPGPLSGAYCRPCIPHCKDKCVGKMGMLEWFSWTEWRNGSLEICDARKPWQEGWEEIFDKLAGNMAAKVRRRVKEMKTEECVREMEDLKRKTEIWNGPNSTEVCILGLLRQIEN